MLRRGLSRFATRGALLPRPAPAIRCRTPGSLAAPRRPLASTAAPAPAICAVQLAAKRGHEAELEAWLSEGRQLLEQTLHSHRDKAAVPSAHIVGSEVRSCFHWVHIPSTHKEAGVDTVAIGALRRSRSRDCGLPPRLATRESRGP